MTALPTLGAYIKHRRQAQGLELVDVAAKLRTVPQWTEHDRAHWLKLIEADAVPLDFGTVTILQHAVRFDPRVLFALEQLRQGLPVLAPRLCRICCCSQFDPSPVIGRASWAGVDLCSACAPLVGAAA